VLPRSPFFDLGHPSINQSINQSLRNEEPINVDTAEVAHVPELEPLVREQVGGNDDELSVNVLI
jgi:hypothetical protein